MKSSDEKLIIYLGGGAMAGVFSGGVLARLEKINFYDKIEAIFAGSAGAMNAAWFLAKQTQLGATIYFDDLTHNFILPKNIPIGIAKLMWNRCVWKLPKDGTRYAVNVDYAIDLITRRKHLMVDEIRKQKIELWVKLLNTRTGNIEYLSAKDHNVISLLRAASCCWPYYPFSENIGGSEYVDGTIPEPIGLQYLLDTYPERKIVVVVNSFLERRFVNSLRCFAEGLVGHFCDHPLFEPIYHRERSLRADLKLALVTSRVLLVCPPPGCPAIAMTQDRADLVKAFEIGKEMADEVVTFHSRGLETRV